MFWSISESRTFRRCQRQWCFKNLLGNAKAKDPTRREAYLLGKLQSVSSWRGTIVDSVVSEFVIPAIRSRRSLTLREAVGRARRLFDTQLEFARRHPLREPGLSPSKLEGQFAAFHVIEYGQELLAEELTRAWQEIETALGNLFGMSDLFAELRGASMLCAQRALTFPHSGMTVRAVPDAVAFFRDKAPLIVDWKVHAFGLHEAWLQLATYAVALVRCNPHVDFPQNLSRWKTTEVKLAEVQLLTNRIRRYELGDEDETAVDSYIAESVTEMLLAIEGKKGKEVNVIELPVASSPDACQRCPYRKLCWEDNR
jgi:hypothetical protein